MEAFEFKKKELTFFGNREICYKLSFVLYFDTLACH